ncbi:MAG: hypothetical protein GY765_00230 [bacterium]|nr:hypothetical protein [bacterium]
MKKFSFTIVLCVILAVFLVDYFALPLLAADSASCESGSCSCSCSGIDCSCTAKSGTCNCVCNEGADSKCGGGDTGSPFSTAYLGW